MLSFEDPSVLENFVQNLAKDPMPQKMKDEGLIYLSHYDFGGFKSFRTLPKLVDFGLAQRTDGPEPLRHPIQPPLFHAPEVILGTGWSYSADIWNLGVLVSLSAGRLLLPQTNYEMTPRFGTS
jgi:serine/threonine protein kinase